MKTNANRAQYIADVARWISDYKESRELIDNLNRGHGKVPKVEVTFYLTTDDMKLHHCPSVTLREHVVGRPFYEVAQYITEPAELFNGCGVGDIVEDAKFYVDNMLLPYIKYVFGDKVQ